MYNYLVVLTVYKQSIESSKWLFERSTLGTGAGPRAEVRCLTAGSTSLAESQARTGLPDSDCGVMCIRCTPATCILPLHLCRHLHGTANSVSRICSFWIVFQAKRQVNISEINATPDLAFTYLWVWGEHMLRWCGMGHVHFQQCLRSDCCWNCVECSELTLNIKVYVVLPSCDDTPTTLVSLNYGSYFYVDFYSGQNYWKPIKTALQRKQWVRVLN